jgi:hypothetical protein
MHQRAGRGVVGCRRADHLGGYEPLKGIEDVERQSLATRQGCCRQVPVNSPVLGGRRLRVDLVEVYHLSTSRYGRLDDGAER